MRQGQSGQKKQKSKIEELTVQVGIEKQPSRAGVCIWEGGGQGEEEVGKRRLQFSTDHENTLNGMLKNLDLGEQVFIN